MIYDIFVSANISTLGDPGVLCGGCAIGTRLKFCTSGFFENLLCAFGIQQVRKFLPEAAISSSGSSEIIPSPKVA
jgi:hypothetical protein